MEDPKDVGTFQSLLSMFLSVYRGRSVDTIGTTYVEKNTIQINRCSESR